MPFRPYAALTRICLGLLALFSVPKAWADITIDAALLAAGHRQSFDSLPLTGAFTWANNSTLPGWYASDTAGAFNASAVTINGTATNPAHLVIINVGNAASSDRALAYHTQLASAPTHLGLAFINASGRELTSFSLAYAAEQWKESTNARTVAVAVFYRVGAVAADLPAGSGWTELPALAASTLNGSAPASTARSVSAVPVSVPNGATLWLRWTFTNTATTATNSNDILGIDDVVFSATALAVDSAPVFTLQPASQSASLGDTVTFTASASGSPAPTFQWFKDGASISGATAASYSIPGANASHAGNYSVVATNSIGSATSATATLTVSSVAVKPAITTQPGSLSVAVGANATFSVVATGTAPLSYQWFKGVAPIAGATSPTLAIPGVSAGDAGAYSVTVGNSAGSISSAVAQLTVLLPPLLATPPSAATALTGASASFSVVAAGDGPFTYQWRKAGVALSGATATTATLTLGNVQFADAGAYDVVVQGPGGTTTSPTVTLTVNGPPSIATHPFNQAAYVGAGATFSVNAIGTAPLTYQWRRGGGSIPGATGASLTLSNLQASDSGAVIDVVVSNAFGSTNSAAATLTVTAELAWSAFDLQGFGKLGTGTTGGGVVAETAAAYRKCSTPYEFVKAIYDSSKTAGAVRVIEILNDLDLGYNEVDAATRLLGNFREHATPKLHPRLITTGVSLVDIVPKGGGLTIFSANGATIRHSCLNIKGTYNVILRNLRFDEMWEWDEATKGNYDSNDWDFIDLSNGGVVSNVWIDHCTFTKTYDGIADLKKGTQYVTFSWCRYVGDDGATNPNSFVRQQIAALEASRSSYAFYNFLRNNGFSMEDIIQIIQGHDKCHLMGATELDAQNDVLSATFHHQWFENIWDRCVPRLRGGQVHNYNIYVDDSRALVAKRLRDTRKAAMSSAAQLSLENTYSFNPFLNGSIATEGSAILVEKSFYRDCLTPLRNNQTDPSNPVYTGKIKSIDTIYQFLNTNGTTTTIRGDSTDAGSPMGPFQAPAIPFSWNTADGSAPYAAPPMDNPASLPQILEAGAGAGRLVWPKANWLRTTNADAPAAVAPVVTTQPLSQSVNGGQSATLTVAATGTAPLVYQWFQGQSGDLSTPVGTNAASFTTPALLAATSFWVRVSNSAGSAFSATATVTLVPGFTTWLALNNLSGAAAAFGADPDADGRPNLLEYSLGTDPTRSEAAGEDLTLTTDRPGHWIARYSRNRAAAGITTSVENSSDLAIWTSLSGTPTVESTTATLERLALGFDSSAPRLFIRLRVRQP
jgi:pectate lyase